MNTSAIDYLRREWQMLCADLPTNHPNIADALFADLCGRYAEPHRHYHNLTHIVAVWKQLLPYYTQLEQPNAVQWAILYHDAIYDTTRSDNEAESSRYARQCLTQLCSNETLQARVEALILATQTHTAPPADSDMAYFLDADLAILGSSTTEYAVYSHAIRQEYSWVIEEWYSIGRIRVLQQLADQTDLYKTHDFRASYDTQARKNIANEIAQWQVVGNL